MKTGIPTIVGVVVLGLVVTSVAGDADRGKEVYDTIGACFACHGADGKGDTPVAASLNPKPRSFVIGEFLYDTDEDGAKGTKADLKNIIKYGAAKYGGSVMMAGRADLSDEDVDALVAFILSLKTVENVE